MEVFPRGYFDRGYSDKMYFDSGYPLWIFPQGGTLRLKSCTPTPLKGVRYSEVSEVGGVIQELADATPYRECQLTPAPVP